MHKLEKSNYQNIFKIRQCFEFQASDPMSIKFLKQHWKGSKQSIKVRCIPALLVQASCLLLPVKSKKPGLSRIKNDNRQLNKLSHMKTPYLASNKKQWLYCERRKMWARYDQNFQFVGSILENFWITFLPSENTPLCSWRLDKVIQLANLS